MNLRECFNFNGNFIPKLAYIELFKTLPSNHELSLSDESLIDCEKLSAEFFRELLSLDLSEDIVFSTCYFSTGKTSAVDDEDDEYDHIDYFGDYTGSGYTVIDCTRQHIWSITKNTVALYHNTIGNIKLFFDSIVKKLPRKEIKAESAKIGLIAYDREYYTINSKIQKTNINVEENYNDNFLSVYDDIVNFLNQRGSGIIIMNGTKGTGKTSIIRHLCSQLPKKYCIVTNAIAQRLAEPEFLSYMMSCKDSVFILEDCEQILMDRSENFFGGAIANILNMSDGLMSDIFNIKFICTFNADIEKIDSALLRKGRCFANYEFKPLCEEKTKALLEKRGISISDEDLKPMTLAEIYNYESTDYEVEKVKSKKKIGF